MNWWIRAYLLFAAVQGFGIGLTGLLVPPEMQIPLRITPLNARFTAALYVAGGIGVLLAASSRRREAARLFVIAFAFATLLILVLTVLHWSDFMADSLPHRPVWIFDYLFDPLVGLVVIIAARLWPARNGSQHGLTALLRVQAIVFGALGLLLLLVPDAAAAYWPWALPPVLGQLYACFILTFSAGAVLASREPEPRAIRDFLIASLSLCLLVLIASVLHVDRFKPEPVSVAWFALFGVGATAFGTALTRSRSVRLPQRATVSV